MNAKPAPYSLPVLIPGFTVQWDGAAVWTKFDDYCASISGVVTETATGRQWRCHAWADRAGFPLRDGVQLNYLGKRAGAPVQPNHIPNAWAIVRVAWNDLCIEMRDAMAAEDIDRESLSRAERLALRRAEESNAEGIKADIRRRVDSFVPVLRHDPAAEEPATGGDVLGLALLHSAILAAPGEELEADDEGIVLGKTGPDWEPTAATAYYAQGHGKEAFGPDAMTARRKLKDMLSLSRDNVVARYRKRLNAIERADFDACPDDMRFTIACEEMNFDPDAAEGPARPLRIKLTGGTVVPADYVTPERAEREVIKANRARQREGMAAIAEREAGELGGPGLTETIDMTPTWAAILPALLAAVTDGTAEGQRIARGELARMAEAADKWNANAPAMKERDSAFTGREGEAMAAAYDREIKRAREVSAMPSVLWFHGMAGDGCQAPGAIVVRDMGESRTAGRYAVHFANFQDGGFHSGDYLDSPDEAARVASERLRRYDPTGRLRLCFARLHDAMNKGNPFA